MFKNLTNKEWIALAIVFIVAIGVTWLLASSTASPRPPRRPVQKKPSVAEFADKVVELAERLQYINPDAKSDCLGDERDIASEPLTQEQIGELNDAHIKSPVDGIVTGMRKHRIDIGVGDNKTFSLRCVPLDALQVKDIVKKGQIIGYNMDIKE